MIPKYTVEYHIKLRQHAQALHYATDDPVACEEFLVELLERGYRIQSVKHEGLAMPPKDFDKLIKIAAGMLAARHICVSLGIDVDEEKYRFGMAA